MNKLNDLTGSEWLFRSKSVIKKNYGQGSFAHKIRRLNKACKPPLLCKDIIEIFSHKGDLILDPFAGTGGIILGAQMAGRRAVGCEINKSYIDAYQSSCDELNGLFNTYDKNAILHKSFFNMDDQYVDLVFADPPYFDMDSRKKSTRIYKGIGSLERPMDKFGIYFKDINDWKKFIFDFCKKSFNMIKNGKYMISFMEDMYINGEYIFLTDLLCQEAKNAGWKPQGEYIWYNEARRASFFGYPVKMITSRTHTSILFFKKP
jgi:DNA modification methylase